MKVNEIFYSLQGEGRFTGTPAVFVRLSGCNMRCDFCDTAHEDGTEMSEQEIVEAVCAWPAGHVVLTGGEPTLQITATFVAVLKRAGKVIHLETNGSRPLDPAILELLDWITVSPKSGMIPAIQRIDELKVVFDMARPDLPARYARLDITHPQCYYLQPCDRGDEEYNALNLTQCIEYIKANPVWKLSLQTHKMLGLR